MNCQFPACGVSRLSKGFSELNLSLHHVPKELTATVANLIKAPVTDRLVLCSKHFKEDAIMRRSLRGRDRAVIRNNAPYTTLLKLKPDTDETVEAAEPTLDR